MVILGWPRRFQPAPGETGSSRLRGRAAADNRISGDSLIVDVAVQEAEASSSPKLGLGVREIINIIAIEASSRQSLS